MAYQLPRDLYAVASIAASAVTSEIMWVGDALSISLELIGSPSTTTIQLSNEDGFTAVLPETSWSDVTTIISPSPDMLDIAPGARWMRLLRSETTSAFLNLVNRPVG